MTVLVVNRWPLSEARHHEWLDPQDTVLLTTSDALDGLSSRVVESFREVVALDQVPDADWELRAHHLHDHHGFDALVAPAERDLLRAARLRTAWGIQGQDVASASAYRDKLRMKEVLAAAGVPVAAHTAVDDPTRLLTFLRDLAGPVVVKPRRGASSVGVQVVRDEADLHRLVRAGLFDGPEDVPAHLLAEEFVEHNMFQVNGLVRDGRTALSWPAYTSSCLAFESGQALLSHTLDAHDPQLEPLLRMAEDAVRALPGPPLMLFHAEVFARPDGSLVFNEIGSRIGGARVREEYELAFGVDLLEWYVRLSAGQQLPDLPHVRPRRHAGYAMVPPGRGVVRALPDGHPSAPDVVYRPQVALGDLLDGAHSSNDAMAAFLAAGDHAGTVLNNLQDSVAWFRNGIRLDPA